MDANLTRINRLHLKTFFVIVSFFCLAAPAQGQTSEIAFDVTAVPKEIDVESMIERIRSIYETLFNRLDIDEDRYLSKDEYLFLTRYPLKEEERSNEHAESTPSSSGHDGVPSRIETPLDVAEIEFDMFDTDKDERISWDEMMARIDHIHSFDINKDGTIERRELLESLNLKTSRDEDPPETE